MIRKIVHITDSLLTAEAAQKPLDEDKLQVIWFTNRTNRVSVVHSHPYYEAILPIAGEVLYSYDGNLYTLHAGEMIIFPPETYHYGKYDENSEISERLVIQVDAELWDNMAKHAGLEHAAWSNEVTVLSAEAVSAWDIRGLLERMSLAGTMTPTHKDKVYASQLLELVTIIDQIVSEKHVEAPAATSALVAKAVSYVQEHYAEPGLSVAELAEYTFVSRGHLSRAFKEYTMESVHNYITNLRMQHCRQSIAEGKTILEACTESGFSDYSSFVKTFRKMYGITPKAYRAQLTKRV